MSDGYGAGVQHKRQDEPRGLPTETYEGRCPETGMQTSTEVACPEGWSVTDLSVYGVTWERDVDGLVAHHAFDDRRAGRDSRDELVIDGETVLDGRVTKRDAVEYLSELSEVRQ